jgi:Domain of unknown function (DUF4132)
MARKKAAAETAPPPPPPVYTAVTHTIALHPADWYLAAWRNTPPRLRPVPAPFDLKDCVERLGGVPALTYSNWVNARIADTLSREEAQFWLLAMTGVKNDVKPKEFALYLGRQTYDGKVGLVEVKARLAKAVNLPAEILLPLANLLTTEDLAHLLVSNDLKGENANIYRWAPLVLSFAEHFAYRLLPYLTEADRGIYRPILRPSLDPTTWSTGYGSYAPLGAYLAALVGLPEDLLALVSSWPDDRFTTGYAAIPHYQQPQLLLFGLGEPGLVRQHMRRLKLQLYTPLLVRGWLAHTELSDLDYIRETILAKTDKADLERLTTAFALVQAPEAAPFMLEIRLNTRSSSPARQWLEQQVGNAIAGLLAAAAGRGKLADAALDYLREAKRKGHLGIIEEQVKLAPADVADKIRRLVVDYTVKTYPPFDDATTPEWLKKALQETHFFKSKLPEWASAATLPPLVLGERCLNEAQFAALLDALRNSTLATPLPLVTALKAHGDRMALDAFVWKLFEVWQSEGMPAKEKWAFLSLAQLGGDGVVLKLTPLVRAWPGEGGHARAVTGLECLRTIGTDTALMQLNGIAQKLKFQGLKKKAQGFMEDIARDMNLSRSELEDRIVPDLELDARGSRVFDFGPRQFKLVFGEDVKPMIREENGKLKTDLPKPTKTDDAEKANAAVAAWKLLKKQVKEVLKTQVNRLEQAMVSCRRWPVKEFESYLVKHPLMINLVRLLLWGGYDEKGKLVRSFRVTEEQEYATAEDTACKLDGLASIGIVHPLHLTDEGRAAWGEVFSDYELLPPFPQLGRRVQKLQPGEENTTTITRFRGPKINPLTLRGILEKTGWNHGPPGDGGVFSEHTKVFQGANTTAVLCYEDGIPIGYMEGAADQEITETFFVEGTGENYRRWKKDQKLLKLGEVDPVVISEVLDILSVLASKGT